MSSAVREEMLDLADRLDRLTDDQWNSPSLCSLWRVRDVLAHLVAGAEGAFGVCAVLRATVRYGFDFDRWVAVDGQERGQQEPAFILAALRNAGANNSAPARARPAVRALAHVLIHGQDICRPLGIDRALPESHLVPVADFVATSIIFRAKKRISGLRLIASDADWSYGNGPEISGPAEALVMMMAGRLVALDDLSGEGVDAIRRRAVEA
jgi:uncharacterized protein (TIGR03083 family)